MQIKLENPEQALECIQEVEKGLQTLTEFSTVIQESLAYVELPLIRLYLSATLPLKLRNKNLLDVCQDIDTYVIIFEHLKNAIFEMISTYEQTDESDPQHERASDIGLWAGHLFKSYYHSGITLFTNPLGMRMLENDMDKLSEAVPELLNRKL